MIILHEIVQCNDGTWRVGNSIEVKTKKKAKDLIKKGEAKLLELPIYEIPNDWQEDEAEEQDLSSNAS